MYNIAQLSGPSNPLSHHYQAAAVDQRVLLNGHHIQACPDISRVAHDEAWNEWNTHLEEQIDRLWELGQQVREGFAGLIQSEPERIALASSVHDFVVRFVSALPLQQRPKIVTTDGEHPSVLRQLRRLAEAGIELVEVESTPAATVVERIQAQLDDKTAAVCVSSVFFETGHQALELDTLMPQCLKLGIELFVDAYQSVNVQPFSVADSNLQQAFVVGGGSKYCQLGPGICFMHVPAGCRMRPEVTGWYGTFDPSEDSPAALPIAYGDDHALFDGSSCDPTSYYRACRVFDFFRQQQLDPELLFDWNHFQLNYLVTAFQQMDFDPKVVKLTTEVEYMGGFLALYSPHARRLCVGMRDRGVHTDWRKNWLRLGPAPYTSQEQLEDGLLALEESVREL